MRQILSLNEQMEELYSLSIDGQRDDNSANRERMKKMLVKAMKTALTDRQMSCLSMYYFDELKTREIAEILGLSQSTVSRHLTAARKNLQKLRAFV